MFNHLDINSPLKSYITAHCSHLLEQPVGDTGIPVSNFDPENFLSNIATRQLTETYSKLLVRDLVNKAGTYAFYTPELNKYCVGANINFFQRLPLHYHNDGDKLLYEAVDEVGGFHHFKWQAITITPNHYIDFVQNNLDQANDYQTYRILKTFTQYETRLTEQALKSYLNPALNGKGDITFPINWDPNEERLSNFNSRSVTAVTEDGTKYEFSSFNSASTVLGTSRKTIETVVNHVDTTVECPSIGARCSFFEEGRPMKTGSPYLASNPYARQDMEGIDYNTLPKAKVLAFDENFELKAEFANSSDAAKKCGFGSDYYRIARNINKSFVEVMLAGVGMRLLFAQNPLSKGRSKAVVCIDTITNEVLGFAGVTDWLRYFNHHVDSSYYIKAHLKGKGLFLDRYRMMYLEDYKGPMPTLIKVPKSKP